MRNSRLITSAVCVAVAFAALVVIPQTAVALTCPVCFDANEENRVAFLATTALLTLLPLGMVGGAVLWLLRRAKLLQSSDQDGELPR